MNTTARIVLTVIVLVVCAVLIAISIIYIPKLTEGGGFMKKETWTWGTEMNASANRTTEPGVPKVFAKDGAYTWWTNALALRYVGQKDKTYLSYVNENGQMSVTSLDHETGQYVTFTLANFEKDDHNSAALGILPDGKILAVYARHSADKLIRWRISDVEDISNFTEEKSITSAGSVTYIQLHRIGQTKYRIFYRYSMNNWATRVYDYSTDSWTEEVVWLNEPNGGQYYLWTQADKTRGKINVFMTCHPNNGKDQAIRYGYFDQDGNIYTTGGKHIGDLNTSKASMLTPRDFDAAYVPEEVQLKTRLFDTSFMGDKVACLFGVFTGPENCSYKYCYYEASTGEWVLETVTDSGWAAVPGNRYFGGISFDKKDMQTLYVSKEKDGVWSIEKWVTSDYGKTWTHTVLDTSDTDVLIRPIIPFNAHDDTDVIYMKGKYPTYLTYDTDLVSYAD